MPSNSALSAPDSDELEHLNDEYINAIMTSDVGWFQEHLADDFVCIESDGAVLDKSHFLRQAAKGPDVADYQLQEVHVRMFRDVALVCATGRFSRTDGSSGLSRYIDVYARIEGDWKTVSAQITRASTPVRQTAPTT